MTQIKQLLALLIFGSLALVPTIVLSGQPLNFKADLIAVPVEEVVELEEPKIKLDLEHYNSYIDAEGRFSFDYKNNYEVFENKGITYLQELSTKETAFQIFENSKEFSFSKSEYNCELKGEKELCWSNSSPYNVMTNLELFPGGADDYKFLSRSEALYNVLRLAYPDEKFSQYADSCFSDVDTKTKYSGAICFAKDKEIVVGVSGAFLPDRAINLTGLVQYLILSFELEDLELDEDVFPDNLFELMTPYHVNTPQVAKAYYEGWIQNPDGHSLWANRHIYEMEASQIVQNFLDWQDGKVLKDYESQNTYALPSVVFYQDPNRDFIFKERSATSGDIKGNHPVYFKENTLAKTIDVYAWETGKVWEYLTTFEGSTAQDIAGMSLDYDGERMEMDIYATYVDGKTSHFELKIKDKDFAHLKGTNSTLKDPNLLPNIGPNYPVGLQPQLKVWLTGEDYQNLLAGNGSDVRFPAHMEITYPNGLVESQAVLIKTRGNANRSYIKPGFTVESFSRFETGDFLNGQDEFKLRSAIDDEAFITEQLFYDTYRALGRLAPETFASTLTINGQEFGFYQITEAVKDDFFEDRDINTDDYYYARNISSEYSANLSNPTGDEETVLAHYKIKGDEDRLLELIQALGSDDPNLIHQIDTQNIYDYTAFIYRTNAFDSIQGNFYIYWNKDSQKWKIFPWDGDKSFVDMPEFSEENLRIFGTNTTGLNNKLIHYVFTHLDSTTRHEYYQDFTARWDARVQLTTWLDQYKKSYEAFLLFENELWNHRFLQREDAVYNSLHAIAELRKRL